MDIHEMIKRGAKIELTSIHFNGSNHKEIEAFGAKIIAQSRCIDGPIIVVDNRGYKHKLYKSDKLLKNEQGDISLVICSNIK